LVNLLDILVLLLFIYYDYLLQAKSERKEEEATIHKNTLRPKHKNRTNHTNTNTPLTTQ